LEVRIDPEFRALIPPLSAEERAGLEEDIRRDGCRDRLIVWQEEGILLDGHNRYDICTQHRIKFGITQKSFPSRDDARLWVIRHQLNRRNLAAIDRIELVRHMEDIVAAKAAAARLEGNRKGGASKSSINLPTTSPEQHIDTRKEMASLAGVSEGSYDRGKRVIANGVPELREAVREGLGLFTAAEVAKLPAETQKEVLSVAKANHTSVAVVLKEQLPASIPKEPGATVLHVNGKARKPRKAPQQIKASTAAARARAVEMSGLPDGEWLARMPLEKVLVGVSLRKSGEDALAYRYCEAIVAMAPERGPFRDAIAHLLGRFAHPMDWRRCDGCKGSGNSCRACGGAGYVIPHTEIEG